MTIARTLNRFPQGTLVAFALVPTAVFAQKTPSPDNLKPSPPPPMGRTTVAGRDQKAKLPDGTTVALTRISRIPEPPQPISWGPDGKPLPLNPRLQSRLPPAYQNRAEYEFEATFTNPNASVGARNVSTGMNMSFLDAQFEMPAILRGSSPWGGGGGHSSSGGQIQSVSGRFFLPMRLPAITLDLAVSTVPWTTVLVTAPDKPAQCKLGNGVLSVTPYTPSSGSGQPQYTFAPSIPLVNVSIPSGYDVQVVTIDQKRWSRSLSRYLPGAVKTVSAVISSPAGQRRSLMSYARFGGQPGTTPSTPAPPAVIQIQVRPLDRIEFQKLPLQPNR